ncbi:hypothetical protein pb186bvf_018626 [Paramecium bursaria]
MIHTYYIFINDSSIRLFSKQYSIYKDLFTQITLAILFLDLVSLFLEIFFKSPLDQLLYSIDQNIIIQIHMDISLVQDSCLIVDEEQKLFVEKYFATLGTKQNPIQSHLDLYATIKHFGSNQFYYRFGKGLHKISTYSFDGQIWIKLLTIYINNVRSFLFDQTYKEGSTDKIDIETSTQLLKLGKDICFSACHFSKSNPYTWLLRNFVIEQHKSSTLSKEEQFLNYISGKTPTGYEWDQNAPDGFMQISGNFDTFGKINQRKVKFSNKKPFCIQRNSYITVQIGQKNDQKWIVKYKQDNDFLEPRETKLPVKYGWLTPRTTWLRIL